MSGFVCALQVDTAAQIPWYERLSELKMPWEMRGDKQTAIKDLNLRVCSGQMLAVIGSSGRNKFKKIKLNRVINKNICTLNLLQSLGCAKVFGAVVVWSSSDGLGIKQFFFPWPCLNLRYQSFYFIFYN